ncbi:M20/M25/M40 family metallo-hydrolase [Desulfovibrio cuneatus]|uniref:M20/M25/M40 family metallo-hydrolase n=1 Tax=Desulfovibrio cuneatus TaxID=159728 RepID=UPI00041F38A9|nr:M20/M25/M40 family metallo-hydrolase [Desulfovibrio cuneatus]
MQLADQSTSVPEMLGVLLEDLSRQQGQVIGLQRELVAFAALNPEHGGQGEAKKSRWIANWLRERGILSLEEMDYLDKRVESNVRPTLVVQYPHKRTHEKKPMLWLFARLDVPPAGPDLFWASPPFTLRVCNDTLYGRGVEDNNQAIVTGLLLLDAMHRHTIEPPMGFGLVLVPGALVDFSVGIERILEDRADLFHEKDMFLLLHYGKPDGSVIEVAEKVNQWLKITVIGKQGYAGYPEMATNALAAGMELAQGLPGLQERFPDTSPMFHGTALFAPTRVEDNTVDGNHIPGIFSFYVDVRIDPAYPKDAPKNAVLALATTIEAKHGVHVAVEQMVATAPAPPTSEKTPVVVALQRAVMQQCGLWPTVTGIDGASLATAIRAKGYPVAVWGMLHNLRNQSDEYMTVSAHLEQAKVLARMLFGPQLPPRVPGPKP